MNTAATSKETILKASRELIREQGWAAVNIRNVASECGISIGCVYNYFPNKSGLITAVIESIWYDIFHLSDEKETFDSFRVCVEWIFDCIQKGNEKYPNFFTMHSMSFIRGEKSEGQQLMLQSWEHIRHKLYTVLMNDTAVRADAFDDSFTPRKFIELIFSLIISSLLRQDYDTSAIMGMIRRILY